jgi:acyl-homoserine lactone acylase PvdQ
LGHTSYLWKTDADAVFGLMYAQCEDDFKRVEMNYIEKLGRMAEVKGESELYNDLLIKLVIDSADAVKDYNNAPAWLKKLCNSFADGINYYLYKNPTTKPVLLDRFKALVSSVVDRRKHWGDQYGRYQCK